VTDPIVIEATAAASPERVWACFTDPAHIVGWNFASEDWCCPRAQNDAWVGGALVWRMEARDGSIGFDLEGTYTEVDASHSLAWNLSNGRAVQLELTADGPHTRLVQRFEPEHIHSRDLQTQGWQAILTRFAAYCTALPG
jgi:uncharacterized protein YndB with AHSA1/START domain